MRKVGKGRLSESLGAGELITAWFGGVRLSGQGTLKIKSGGFAKRPFLPQQVASREQPLHGQGRWQMVAGLVGCGAGFSLWLCEAGRCVAVVKAVVKWALTWSAKGRAAG